MMHLCVLKRFTLSLSRLRFRALKLTASCVTRHDARYKDGQFFMDENSKRV